ncbi:MAG: 6-phosphofructokinase, partial [Lentisphaeria bacterium]|nr:6-phosphofructokinase [Lentisphaeria bacterium]
MPDNALDRDMFRVDTIGECKIDSPLRGTKVHFTSDEGLVLVDKHFSELSTHFKKTGKIPVFEEAGPREKIFHDPRWSKAAILTAGGLCPGLNSVIKGLTMTLKQTYGVPLVHGIPYGYAGLNPASGYAPVVLDEAAVDNIHEQGGTILGTSRGAQDTDVMLETLMRLDINMLFCVGGDGTLRSAHELAEAAKRRSLNISI